MTIRHLTALAILSLPTFVLACTSHGAASTEEDAASSEAALVDGARASTAINQGLAAAASLVDIEAVLEPSRRVDAELVMSATRDKAVGCGELSRIDAGVSLDFGTGCLLPGGVTVSGAASITAGRSGDERSIAIELRSLVVQGFSLDGTARFSRDTAGLIKAQMALTTASGSYTTDLQIVSVAGGLIVDGPATVTKDDATSSLTFAGLHHTIGACYADAGTVTITRAGLTQTATFDASTPATGVVTVTVGRITTTTSLPPYGNCPSA